MKILEIYKNKKIYRSENIWQSKLLSMQVFTDEESSKAEFLFAQLNLYFKESAQEYYCLSCELKHVDFKEEVLE